MSVPELQNAPHTESFDELREELLDEVDELDERDKRLIEDVERNGRREDIGQALRNVFSRLSMLQKYYIASLTDEQLEELLPDWHELSPDEEEEP